MAPETFAALNRRRGAGSVVSPRSKAKAMLRALEESVKAAEMGQREQGKVAHAPLAERLLTALEDGLGGARAT